MDTREHHCGGTLYRARLCVLISETNGVELYSWINGWECSACGDQILSAHTASLIEQGETELSWFPNETGTVGTVLVTSNQGGWHG